MKLKVQSWIAKANECQKVTGNDELLEIEIVQH